MAYDIRSRHYYKLLSSTDSIYSTDRELHGSARDSSVRHITLDSCFDPRHRPAPKGVRSQVNRCDTCSFLSQERRCVLCTCKAAFGSRVMSASCIDRNVKVCFNSCTLKGCIGNLPCHTDIHISNNTHGVFTCCIPPSSRSLSSRNCLSVPSVLSYFY